MNKQNKSIEEVLLNNIEYSLSGKTFDISGCSVDGKIIIKATGSGIEDIETEGEVMNIKKGKLNVEEGTIKFEEGFWVLSIISGGIEDSQDQDYKGLTNVDLKYEPDKKSKISFYNEEQGISIKELTITLDGIKRIFTPKGINQTTIASKTSLAKVFIAGTVISILSSMALDKPPREVASDGLENIASSLPHELDELLDMTTINTSKETIGTVSKNYLLDSIINDNFPHLNLEARKAIYALSNINIGAQKPGDTVYRKAGKVYFYSGNTEYLLEGLK